MVVVEEQIVRKGYPQIDNGRRTRGRGFDNSGLEDPCCFVRLQAHCSTEQPRRNPSGDDIGFARDAMSDLELLGVRKGTPSCQDAEYRPLWSPETLDPGERRR